MDDEVLGFGKHREKTFREAAAIPEYAQWALGIAKPKGRLETFVTYVNEHAPAVPAAPPPARESDSEEDQPLKSRAVAKKRVRAAEAPPPVDPAADEAADEAPAA
eukprot:4495078-Prymnesium_polylepis.1